MLKPLSKNFKGITVISGPTKSGKSQLAEFLIKEQRFINYIATSKPRYNDREWQTRINIHRRRRPDSWKTIEHPDNICNVIKSIGGDESILIDSLGGLVEQRISENEDKWESFQSKFIDCLLNHNHGIYVVSEEIGWGLVSSTKVGHIFRERLSHLSSLLCSYSTKKWLAVNGTAIDLDKIGFPIP